MFYAAVARQYNAIATKDKHTSMFLALCCIDFKDGFQLK